MSDKINGSRFRACVFLLFLSLAFTQAWGGGGAPSSRLRILFVGNSYTYINDLPMLVKTLFANSGLDVDVQSVTRSSATLEQHWNDGYVQRLIGSEHWDYLVLQEKSTWPIENSDKFFEFSGRFNELANSKGVKAVLFNTWARRGSLFLQQSINAKFIAAAEGRGIKIAPVGSIWSLASSEGMENDLYQRDGSHPSIKGSFLAACTLYRVLAIRQTKCNFGPRFPVGSVLSPVEADVIERAVVRTLGAKNGF